MDCTFRALGKFLHRIYWRSCLSMYGATLVLEEDYDDKLGALTT